MFYPELVPTGVLAIYHPRPEFTSQYPFLEVRKLDISHAALETLQLVAKAQCLDWQSVRTPSPFSMELPAPKQSCSTHNEKTGAPGVTMSGDFYDLFSEQEVKIAGRQRA